jgi:ElaB/YqjD/DUF883 family membrane-anchored ribosome-binding protein
MKATDSEKQETLIFHTLDEMKNTMKNLADSYATLTGEVIKSGVRIEGILKTQENHEARIAEIKTAQDSCPARHQMKGVWSRLKHFEDFKDMVMSQTKEDSKAIDVYAQRVQHAAEMASAQSMPNPWKDVMVKIVLWVLIGLIVGASLSSIFVYEYVSGRSVPTISGKP